MPPSPENRAPELCSAIAWAAIASTTGRGAATVASGRPSWPSVTRRPRAEPAMAAMATRGPWRRSAIRTYLTLPLLLHRRRAQRSDAARRGRLVDLRPIVRLSQRLTPA